MRRAVIFFSIGSLFLACMPFAPAWAEAPSCLTHVAGEETGAVDDWRDEAPGALLLRTEKGLFRYDGARVARVAGEETGTVDDWRDEPPGALLLRTWNGVFRYDGARVARV